MKICPQCNEEVPKAYNICWNCSYNFTTQKNEGFVSNDSSKKVVPDNSKKLKCLRCDTQMNFEKAMKMHEGFNWGIFGELGHLFTNHESFNIFVCPNCNKVEFFVPPMKDINK